MLSREEIVTHMGEIVAEYEDNPHKSAYALGRFLGLYDAIKLGELIPDKFDVDAEIEKINAQPDTPLGWCEDCQVWMLIHGAGYECPSCQAYYD